MRPSNRGVRDADTWELDDPRASRWEPCACGYVHPCADFIERHKERVRVGKRVCSEPGCPELIDQAGLCDSHRRAKDRARGTRQERGYDAEYDARRKGDVQRLAAGQVLTCWRCGDVVQPHEYSLGHCDDDRAIIHGPEHLTRCNLANTRGGCPHISHVR